jgi:hypothetical protein
MPQLTCALTVIPKRTLPHGKGPTNKCKQSYPDRLMQPKTQHMNTARAPISTGAKVARVDQAASGREKVSGSAQGNHGGANGEQNLEKTVFPEPDATSPASPADTWP